METYAVIQTLLELLIFDNAPKDRNFPRSPFQVREVGYRDIVISPQLVCDLVRGGWDTSV